MTRIRFSEVCRGVKAGSLKLGVSTLVITALVLAPSAAEARKKQQDSGFFSFFDSPPPKPRNYRVYNQRRQPQPDGDAASPKTAAKPVPTRATIKGPLVISVSLARQRVTVYDIDGPIAEAPISSGQPAFPTLQGVFTILEKSVVHHSNLYNGAPMPNMQRLTWSGTALHAGDLPGYPASHGCIRLPYNFSKQFYGMTKLGERVIVSKEPVVPIAFSHPNLIAPLPPENGTVEANAKPAGTKVAEQVDYESVRSLGLITKADAAETIVTGSLSTEPLTGYRAKRAAEKQQTEEALQTAQSAKIDLEASAKAAVQAAEDARLAAKQARVEADRQAAAAKKAEQARIEGDRAIEAFERKYSGQTALAADEQQKAAATEQQLEDRTFVLGRELDAAREIADKAKVAANEADEAVAAAVAKVKEEAQKLAKANADIKTAQDKLDSFRRQELVRKHPVSVLISRSAGRLFVRQGYEPIFDVPVTFKDPDVAIGTHVFTALQQTGPTEMKWSASSIAYNAPPPSDPKKKKRNPTYDVAPASTSLPQTPQAALDRVTIPEDVRERIADVMKPGSSIIVSDYGISHQTGKFTDFIILTR